VETKLGNDAPGLRVGDVVVRVDPRYFRPTEVETLLGDPSKAKSKLGWSPETMVQEMCREMMEIDLEEAKQHLLLKKHGQRQYWRRVLSGKHADASNGN